MPKIPANIITLCLGVLLTLSPAAAQEESVRTTEEAARSLQAELEAIHGLKIDILEAKGEDIVDVLHDLSEKGKLSIVTGPYVTGKVTIFLQEVYAKDALRIILDANDLAYNEDNGIIRVMTKESFKERYGYPYEEKIRTKMIPLLHANAEDILPVLNEMKSEAGRIIYNSQTQTFVLIDTPARLAAMDTYVKKVDVPIDRMIVEIKHRDAEDIAATLRPFLSENKGSIEVNAEAKSLTIIDTRTNLQEFRKKIEKLDQPERKIVLEVRIIQIILNDEHTKGVDWEAIVSDFKSLAFLGMKNAIEGRNGAISLGTVSGEDYTVLLDALETVGYISEIDDQREVKSKEETAVVPVNGLDAVNFSDDKSNQETKDLEEDMRFYVKPLRYEDGKVTVHIKPEVFSLAEKAIEMQVDDGSTIVIGGIFKRVTVETERRIPLISDIPLIRDVPFEEIPFLGFAFRNSNRDERKTELIVFITTKTKVNP
ncbi:MAG: hypothetical protein KC897_11450 [Candidatus Omnitrophica bacterium]|nr:hypothetical protein [Candidatus Omnitrophota bacterium]MCB9719515.1 hypothetical protein [Candidatus Omnitrophota bacterium]